MENAQTGEISREYLKKLNRKVVEQRIPFSGSFDLTHRCNLRCVHCYIGDKKNIPGNGKRELDTDQWFSIIDQIVEAGCLNLLITGGEPLLRKDFGKIYLHARKNGLLITVFTNGTLITDDILDLFGKFPPRAVEISLYGATVETYEKITGVKGSYEKCLNGIRRLLEKKINVKLKTVLMTLNNHEFFEIENIARELKVRFRFDAAIFPCLNGNKTPIELRVEPEEAVEKEFSDDERSRQWKDFFERMGEVSLSDTLYNCGAGLTSFHVDPYGSLQPCLMVTSLRYDLLAGSFIEGWRNVMPCIRERKSNASSVCKKCEKMTLCGFCPGFFELENSAEDVCSEYLCAIGEYRHQAIESYKP